VARGRGQSINRTFLEAMFCDALPGTHTVVCSFVGDPYKVKRGAWYGRPWAPGDALPWGFDWGNTYLTVSTFEPDPDTGECRRRKALFVALHAVMVDDVGYGMGSKVDRAKLALAPSALIETSPANYQAYYFLQQDTETRDRSLCERTVDAMVAAGLTKDGSDPGMKGVTRYGRLPVGVNGKAKYVKALGKPFPVRLEAFEPDRRYTLAAIREAWKLELAPKQRFETRAADLANVDPQLIEAATKGFDALLKLFKEAGKYLSPEGHAGPWHQVTCPWIDSHTDRADTGAAIAAPGPDNYYVGGFKCWHGHCNGEDDNPKRTMRDVWTWVQEANRMRKAS
jgi:hypothetical protein